MRLILSRKGFDSSSGGCPSPIFPDGSMLSLPIPDARARTTYAELSWRGRDLGALVERLSRGRLAPGACAHLDPDLRAALVPRAPGWRAALGQEGAAAAHLARQGVRAGDLFLFFGLFQRVDATLAPVGRPFHAIWGWLQVGEVADVDAVVRPALATARWRWAAAHPHVTVREGARRAPNVLYVAAPRLTLPGVSAGATAAKATRPSLATPGAGVFERFRPALRLTADAARGPSRWSLPRWFLPAGRTPLSYHPDPARWTPDGEQVILKSVGRGQEFVLDCAEYPEAIPWARRLLCRAPRPRRAAASTPRRAPPPARAEAAAARRPEAPAGP